MAMTLVHAITGLRSPASASAKARERLRWKRLGKTVASDFTTDAASLVKGVSSSDGGPFPQPAIASTRSAIVQKNGKDDFMAVTWVRVLSVRIDSERRRIRTGFGRNGYVGAPASKVGRAQRARHVVAQQRQPNEKLAATPCVPVHRSRRDVAPTGAPCSFVVDWQCKGVAAREPGALVGVTSPSRCSATPPASSAQTRLNQGSIIACGLPVQGAGSSRPTRATTHWSFRA